MLTDRLFNRIHREDIARGLADLGVRRGDALLALVSMRRIGWVSGGAASILEALREAIGPEGSLLAPAYPALDPLPAPLPEGVFDAGATPSAAGRLSEAIRDAEGAMRSLHPVGSMTALGPLARPWLEGHETHASPFEAGTPVDRFVEGGGRILAVGTHMGPVLPLLQERAQHPFLYLTGVRETIVRAREGASRRVLTRIFRSSTCQIVILQGERPEARDFALIRDYALIFPSDRAAQIEKDGFLRHNRGRLLGRLERLKQRGLLRTGHIGSAEAALVEAKPFCAQVGADLEWEIERFKDEYDPERLELLGLRSVS